MPSFGILLVTFIVWIHSISDTYFTFLFCEMMFMRCPKDRMFTDRIYMFLIPVLTIIGFFTDISIPLIVLIVIWIVRTIILKGGSTYQIVTNLPTSRRS